jgi:hypothetical protein
MFVHGPHTALVDDDSYSGSDNEENPEDIVQVGHGYNDSFALGELFGGGGGIWGYLSAHCFTTQTTCRFVVLNLMRYHVECCWQNLIFLYVSGIILYLRHQIYLF